MQTDVNSFTLIAKPKNESDTWKIEEHSLCCDARSDSLSFDAVIQPALDHASFYREAIEDKVSKFICGCNVTLATYGAANTGKTHTIIGTAGKTRLKSEARGVIVRAVSQLFDYVHSKENSDKVFHVTASFYHVFDDGRVADLLDTQKRNVDLIAGTDPANGQPYYTAAVTKQTIRSLEEVISLVERGSLMRNASGCVRNKSQQQPSLLKQQPLLQAYKAHLSHAFFCLSLEQKEQQSAKISHLLVVDLAGHNVDKYYSENCEDPGIDDLHRFMTMSDLVLESSSLGKLLSQSFGGNTITVLICNVNLDDSELSIKCLSTVQSLVNKINNKVVVNEIPSDECKINTYLNEADALKTSVAKKCAIDGNLELWKLEDNGQLTINGTVIGELSESCQSIVKKIKEIDEQLIKGGELSKKTNPVTVTPMQLPSRVPVLPVKSKLPALAATPGALRPLPLPLQVANKQIQVIVFGSCSTDVHRHLLWTKV